MEREVQAARDRAVWVRSKDLAALADQLIDALGEFREVLKAGEPEERKAVVRTFLQGIRIEKKTRQAILRWYRLPWPSFVKLVELRGAEFERSCPAFTVTEDEVLLLPLSRRP